MNLFSYFSFSLFQASYCSINDPPLNGGVVNRTKLHPGSRLQFFCNRGYRLVGSTNTTCRVDSRGLYQWDTAAPVCQGRRSKDVLKNWWCNLFLKTLVINDHLNIGSVFIFLQRFHVEYLRLQEMAVSMHTTIMLVARSPISVIMVIILTLVFQWQLCVWRMAAGVTQDQFPYACVSYPNPKITCI